jgi:hypothetical protein
MPRKTKYPVHCPAFVHAPSGDVFEGSPDDETADRIAHQGGSHPVDECVPLTPVAVLVYAKCGGTEDTMTVACSHKRGRKPSRVLSDTEAYVDKADASQAGY